jgi:HAD superfamily hydrolase (TIGR01509 family)
VAAAGDLVRRARHSLLDFDGPVCAVFGALPDHEVADRLRAVLADRCQPVTGAAATAHDPFEVLAYATELDTPTTQAVEKAFRAAEVEAVRAAPQTPGLPAVLDHLTSRGLVVTIVSNNSAAVKTYLHTTGFDRYIGSISARTTEDVRRLKPHPHLLHRAITLHGTYPGECLMIGDSITDIHAAGTPVVAYANKPGKHPRLATHHPDALIDRLTDLFPHR